MKNLALLSALSVLLVCGCVPLNYNATARLHREKSNIQKGILTIGQKRSWFVSEWGSPTKTFSEFIQGNAYESVRTSTSSEKANQKGAGDTSQQSQKEKQETVTVKGRERTCELWVYDTKGVTLIFDQDTLAAWRYHDGSSPR